MKKNLKKALVFVIMILILIPTAVCFATTKDDLDDAKKREQELEQRLKSVKANLSELKKDMKDIEDYITQLDTQMQELVDDITEINDKIEIKFADGTTHWYRT